MRSDTTFQGKRVSHAWGVVLPVVAERVEFRLNSGRRTEREQRELIAEKGVWYPSNPTGAANYSPTAPHIRVGREDHALDVDTLFGDGEAGVQRELTRLGLRTENEIGAEPWHLEAATEAELLVLAARIERRRDVDVLGPTTRRWAVEYLQLLEAKANLPRRRALRRRLVARRKAEWVAWKRGSRARRTAAGRRFDVLRRVTG